MNKRAPFVVVILLAVAIAGFFAARTFKENMSSNTMIITPTKTRLHSPAATPSPRSTSPTIAQRANPIQTTSNPRQSDKTNKTNKNSLSKNHPFNPRTPPPQTTPSPSPNTPSNPAKTSKDSKFKAFENALKTHTLTSVFPCMQARVERGDDYRGALSFKVKAKPAEKDVGFASVSLEQLDGNDLSEEDHQCIWSTLEDTMLDLRKNEALIIWIEKQQDQEFQYDLSLDLKGQKKTPAKQSP